MDSEDATDISYPMRFGHAATDVFRQQRSSRHRSPRQDQRGAGIPDVELRPLGILRAASLDQWILARNNATFCQPAVNPLQDLDRVSQVLDIEAEARQCGGQFGGTVGQGLCSNSTVSFKMAVMVLSPRVWTERCRHGSMTPLIPGRHHKFVQRELAAK
jgi:hypothetical protein